MQRLDDEPRRGLFAAEHFLARSGTNGCKLDERGIWQLDRPDEVVHRSVSQQWHAARRARPTGPSSPQQATAYTVTLSSSITLSGLELNSASLTLAHTNGTLTLNGAADFTSGTFQLNGGTIAGGTLNLSGGGFSILNNANNRFRNVTINGTMSIAASETQLRIADGLLRPGA